MRNMLTWRRVGLALPVAASLFALIALPAYGQTATGTGSMGESLTITPTQGEVGSTVNFTGSGGTNPACQAEDQAEVFFLIGNFSGGNDINPGVVVDISDDASFSGSLTVPDPQDSADPPDDGLSTGAFSIELRCIDSVDGSGGALEAGPEFTIISGSATTSTTSTTLAAPVTTSTVPATSTTVAAAPVPATTTTAPRSGGGTLPKTGSTSVPLTVTGTVLVAVGAAMAQVSRRRSRTRAAEWDEMLSGI